MNLSQAIMVVRTAQNGPLENLSAFDRDKLFISLYKSLQHRPDPASDARALADTVIARVLPQATDSQINTTIITEAALDTLQHFDNAAATHYAAFHC